MSLAEDIKVANICKIQEFLLNKEPHLLELYLDDVLQFAINRSAEVRKTITGFIEEAGLINSFIITYNIYKKNMQYFFIILKLFFKYFVIFFLE